MTQVKPGLSVAQHGEIGEALGAMRQQALGVRTLLREHVGSASAEYVAAHRACQALQNLSNVLLHLAVGEHVDQVPLADLQALYADPREGA